MSLLFKNLKLLDPHWTEAHGGYEVLVEGDIIKEVSAKPIKSKTAQIVDCGKRTLMPGLIDCHVHTHHSEVYINRMEAVPLTLMMARSAGRLRSAGRGRHDQGGVGQADQDGEGQRDRLRQTHGDAGPDRLPRAHPSQ